MTICECDVTRVTFGWEGPGGAKVNIWGVVGSQSHSLRQLSRIIMLFQLAKKWILPCLRKPQISPPTHKMFFSKFLKVISNPQTRNGRGPNLWTYIVRTTPHSPLACCSLPFPCRCRLDLFHTIWKPFSQMQNPNVVFQMDGVQAVPPLRRPYCAKKGHLWSSG